MGVDVATIFRMRRAELRMKSGDVAKQALINPGTYSRIERHLNYPNLLTQRAICEVLKLDYETFEPISEI